MPDPDVGELTRQYQIALEEARFARNLVQSEGIPPGVLQAIQSIAEQRLAEASNALNAAFDG